MNPDQWLENQFKGEFFSGNFDFLKTLIFEELKFSLPSKTKIITVAGTNGKGQTARYISSELEKNNKSIALWTSPHRYSVTERFYKKDRYISTEELLELFEQQKSLFDKNQISYFEFLFINFVKWIEQDPVDYIIFEVGLGGRLDAVNIFDADYAVVTSISRDHTDILGATYRQILFEKLGITRSGKTLFSNFELRYLRQRTREYIQNKNIRYRDLFEQDRTYLDDHFAVRNQKLGNAVLAEVLGKKEYLGEGQLKTRVESFCIGEKVLEFYSSHNLDGIRKLVQFLSMSKYNNHIIYASFSARTMQELRSITKVLLERTNDGKGKLVLVRFNHMRAINEHDLSELAKTFKLEIIDVKDIVSHLQKSQSSRFIATGSNYFLSCLGPCFKSL